MKKLKYLIITCLSFAILSYGVIAFANGGTNADSKVLSHGDVTGKFIAMVAGNTKIKLEDEDGVETYLLDGSIWVFRDQKKTELVNLKSGDKLELILNSDAKVTYIKAFSEVYLMAEIATASVTPAPTAIVTAAPTPTATPEPSPTITPTPNTQIMIVKVDSPVVIGIEDQKKGDDHENSNDSNENLSNDDNNSIDDHHDNNNEHDNQGEED